MSAHHDKPAHAPKPAAPSDKALGTAAINPHPITPVATVLPATTTNTNPTAEPTANTTNGRPLFAVALIVVVTLPIGLGVGVALRPKPVVSAITHSAETHETDSAQTASDFVKSVLANRQKAEELFLAGEFELALQLYQSKEQADSLRPNDVIALQIATCQEELGHFDEALEVYRTFASREDSSFQPVALLSQGRIWIRLRDFVQAGSVLKSLVELASTTSKVPPSIAQDARFLTEIVALLEGTPTELKLDGSEPIPPLYGIEWPVQKSLEQKVSAHDETNPEPAITSSSDATSGEHRLQCLIEQNPRYWLAGQAKLAMAHAAVHRGDFTTAIAHYDELIGKSASSMSVTAAFNRGLIQYKQREFGPAAFALGRMIDGAPGHELIVPALILRGRALMEMGDFETAAYDFKRAGTLRGREDQNGWATTFMGMAFLQMRKNQQAAQTMFALRDRLESTPSRAAAGFVVSLARMEMLTDVESRQREAVFLFRALSAIEVDAEWLGSAGIVLIGRAYRQLNLHEKMVEVFTSTLAKELREPFASEMKFALAEHALASGDAEGGRARLTELRHAKKSEWSKPAALRLAKLELEENHFAECVAMCREIAADESQRRVALKLMGEAFEQSGELDKAAACYAGTPPAP